MKTTAAGKIIGYALAPATKNGKVLMFVQPGYYATPQLASLKSNLAQLHRDNLQLHQENASLRNQFADVLAQVKQKGRPANTAPQDRTSVRIGLPGIRPAWQLLELRDGIWLFECRVTALEDSRWFASGILRILAQKCRSCTVRARCFGPSTLPSTNAS